MTRTQRYIAGGIAVLLGLTIVLEWTAPDALNWTLSLETDDAHPFGSQVPYEIMQALFPNEDVTVRERSPYPLLRDGDAATPTLAIITQHYAPGHAEADALIDYIEQGGTVFLSAMRVGRHLRDPLGIELSDIGQADSLTLANPALQHQDPQPLERAWGSHLTAVDTARTTALGAGRHQPLIDGVSHGDPQTPPEFVPLGDRSTELTFIRWDHGDGVLLLHTVPTVFTNYAAVEDAAWSYLYGVFSYLPDRPIQWVGYYAPTRAAAETPFRYLIMNPSLRTALYIVLGLVLLFLLDGLRRRQRMVPVIDPPENTTRTFVETVGRFYRRHGTHAALARDMKQHAAATVHRRYGLTLNLEEDDMAQRLAQRSAVPIDTVQAVIAALRRIDRPQTSWSNRDLVTLRRHLDAFYRAAAEGQAERVSL